MTAERKQNLGPKAGPANRAALIAAARAALEAAQANVARLEESGLIVDDLVLRGALSWPGFGKGGQDWFGFIFRVTAYSGTVIDRNPEGDLEWVDVDRVLELPLWEGDRHFLPLVFDPAGRPFHGVMPYRDGRPVSWSYSLL